MEDLMDAGLALRMVRWKQMAPWKVLNLAEVMVHWIGMVPWRVLSLVELTVLSIKMVLPRVQYWEIVTVAKKGIQRELHSVRLKEKASSKALPKV